jgi:hypothetical protein
MDENAGLPPLAARSDFGERLVDAIVVADAKATFWMYTTETGWPMLSFAGAQAERIDQPAGRPVIRTESSHWAVQVVANPIIDSYGYYTPERRLLPLWPTFAGFAINTLFYASILLGGWLLFVAPFALRRRIRTKRGLCPACGYNLRGSPATSDACPECGGTLPSPSR